MTFLQRVCAGLTAIIAVPGLSFLTGCGTPGAPQAPSLRLPEPVSDLSAVRSGATVTLRWTMPKRTTDHLLLTTQSKGPIPVIICRREQTESVCATAGEVTSAPGIEAEFHETLPAALTVGSPRQLLYFIEIKNKPGPSGKAAGLSNSAMVAAGAAPGPVLGLSAEVRTDGVALHWTKPDEPETAAVRLHRRLIAAGDFGHKKQESPKQKGILSTGPEPPLRDLLVEAPEAIRAGALDNTARFGSTYEYRAQRIERLDVEGKSFELAGEISPPIQVAVIDSFPPAVPGGLAAVAVLEEKSIDLSWQPDSEADLAGYIVYRIQVGFAENGNGEADWIRISGPTPLIGPAYRDTSVEPGHAYRYAVSAIDQTGHESKRSAEAQESIPTP